MFIYFDNREEWVYFARLTSETLFKNSVFFHVLEKMENIMLNQSPVKDCNISSFNFLEHLKFSDIPVLWEEIKSFKLENDKVYKLTFRNTEFTFRVLFDIESA